MEEINYFLENYELVRQIWEEESIPDELKETIIFIVHKRGE